MEVNRESIKLGAKIINSHILCKLVTEILGHHGIR